MAIAINPEHSVAQSQPAPRPFYDSYSQQIAESARIYSGIEQPADYGSLLALAQRYWLPGDHDTPVNPVDATVEQAERLVELYDEMHLLDEHRLPEGEYDQIVALGGTHSGNHRRLAFLNDELRRGGATTDTIVLLGGERRANPSERTLIEEDVRELKDIESSDPWIKDVATGKAAVETETDMLRLAAVFQLGQLVVVSETSQKVVFEHGDRRVVLINSRAVKRAGPPRHTTESSVADWMELERPTRGAEVGLIATNPHTLRTARTAQRIVGGRAQVIGAGPATRLSHRHELFRGEIARHLYEDKLVSAEQANR